MAVTVNTGAKNLRSDFMISDAAIPQRAAKQNTQTEKFEEMLAKADDKLRKFADIKKAFDEGKYDVPTVEDLKKAGIVIDHADVSKSPKELAEKIVSGEVSIDEIPREEVTPKLLKEVAVLCQIDEDESFAKTLEELDFAEEIMMLTGKLLKRDSEDEDSDEAADANVLASLLSIDVSDEIAEILKALAGEETDGEEVMVEAVGSDDMGIIGEIAENHIKNANEAAENVAVSGGESDAEVSESKNAAVADVIENTAAEQVVSSGNESKAVEIGNENTADEQVVLNGIESKAAESENTATEQAVPNGAESKAVESENAAAEQTVSSGIESKAVEVGNENAAKAVEQSAGAAETVLKSETAEILKAAAENGEISKPEVRTYKAEKTDVQEQETPIETSESVPVRAVDERAKALGEELEMLRNAKQKSETEPKAQDDLSKVRLLHGNITESTVILRKDNGEFLAVSQKDFVSQIQKLVEQVVSENREQNEYSLMLNPEELGKITVKMTKAADGAVSVTIVAENARTQRLLEQNSELIQSNLRNNGVNLENWQTVNESQQNHAAQDYRGSAKNPYFAREDNSDEEQDNDGKSFADIIAAM